MRKILKIGISLGVVLGIVLCIYAFIIAYQQQKPEIVSHSEEVYFGRLEGSANPTIALYGISRVYVRSGKACSCDLTVRWYLNGELVSEKTVTFSLNAGQERPVNLWVTLSYNQTDIDLPYECEYEIVESG